MHFYPHSGCVAYNSIGLYTTVGRPKRGLRGVYSHKLAFSHSRRIFLYPLLKPVKASETGIFYQFSHQQ